MEYQIDFLPIGEKQCGDAILVRFGELSTGDPDKQSVILIDGGYQSDSEQIVGHLKQHYNASSIDLAISTHPDNDHAGGLPGVIETFPVDQLWMHLPWEHSDDVLALRQEDFMAYSLTKKIQKSMQTSSDLAAAADTVGIKPIEPFMGQRFWSPYGMITVLGPTREYYEGLLAEILDKSEKKASGATSTLSYLSSDLRKIIQAATGVFESHTIETLTDNGDTAPSNNTSCILLLEIKDGPKILFTGDAGKPALEIAHLAYDALGHKAGELSLIQVPHHGSRRNVGPSVLDKFLGVRTDNPETKRGNAVVSVGVICEKDGHPKKVTTNAFKRRGYPVTETRGFGKMFGSDRDGWSPVDPLPLFSNVEPES